MHNVISKNKLKETAKLLQKKYRDELGYFIAEGEKALEEMIENKTDIIEIYSLKSIENYKIKAPIYIINEDDMKKISSTKSPCEILTVAKKINNNIDEFKKFTHLILLDEISDPGNLGTIIRSAAAFGVEGIILYGNCVDRYSSKVIRSCTGNFFKIPIIEINSILQLQKYFNKHKKIATVLTKENNISLQECKNLQKIIIMFGSEAKGLCVDLINIADKNIKLDMKNNVDSLNLAVSSSIIMYEIFC